MSHNTLVRFGVARFVAASLLASAGSAQDSDVGWCAPRHPHGFPIEFMGVMPGAFTAADINNDGALDLFSTGQTGSIHLMLGHPHGGLESPFDLLSVTGAIDVEIADLDLDQNPDLVVRPSSGGQVRVYLGDGDADFAFAAIYPMSAATPYNAFDLDLGDLNGDGLQDLVASDVTTRQVAVRLGVGGGAFGAASFTPLTGYPQRLELGDVNGDGDLDLVLHGAVVTSQLGLLLGDGAGGFAAPVTLGMGGVRFVLRDVDGDLDLDLVTAASSSTSGSVRTFLGAGNGTFAAPLIHVVGEPLDGLALGDFNGDGQLDAAAVGQYGRVYVLDGNGPGTFAAPRVIFVPPANGGVLAADFDRDGIDDLACLGSRSTDVLFGSPQHSLVLPRALQGADAARALSVEDLDGDGSRDIVAAHANLTLGSLHGDGALGFTLGASQALPAVPSAMTLGDLDADGHLDALVASRAAQRLDVVRGQPGGAWAPAIVLATGFEFGQLTALDVNLDGFTDVCATTASELAIVFGAAVLPSTTSVIALPSAPIDVASGDVNADGRIDLVLACAGGNALWLRGVATGFALPQQFVLGGDLTSVALGRFDADVFLDAYFGTLESGLVIARGASTGLLSPQTFGPETELRSVRVADFDADGLDDVLCDAPGLGAGTVAMRRGLNGALAPLVAYWMADSLGARAFGDFDGDGRAEVVGGESNGATLRISLRRKGAFVERYCSAGVSVAGCSATLSAVGRPQSGASSGFVVTTAGIDGQRSAMTVFSTAAPLVQPFAPGSTSSLCLRQPLRRTPLAFTFGTAGVCDGAHALDMNAHFASALLPIGSFAFLQTWYRDPLAPKGGNLSDALAAVLEP